MAIKELMWDGTRWVPRLPDAAPPPPPPEPLPPSPTAYNSIGVFRSDNVDRVRQFEQQSLLRDMPGPIVNFAGRGQTSWSQWQGRINQVLSDYRQVCVVEGRHKLSLSISPFPAGSGTTQTLQQAADGDFNSYYSWLGDRIVAEGYPGRIILRIAWEFNGAFYKWTIQGGVSNSNGQTASQREAAYRNMWVNFVTAVRAKTTNVEFDWCPLKGNYSEAAVDRAYPGDAYVDYIGLDLYDTDQSAYGGKPKNMTSWSNSWDALVSPTKQLGLVWQRDKALERGKKASWPEWGISWRTDGISGEDNAIFLGRCIDWYDNELAANGISGYLAYFDWDANDAQHRLQPYTALGTAGASSPEHPSPNALADFNSKMR